jgi:tetratricopeptide (TPR) repeat protein
MNFSSLQIVLIILGGACISIGSGLFKDWLKLKVPKRHAFIGGLIFIIGALISFVINIKKQRWLNEKYPLSTLEYVTIAKNSLNEKNYTKMNENMEAAYFKDKSYPDVIYYYAYSYFLLEKDTFVKKALDILTANPKENGKEQYLRPICLTVLGDYTKAKPFYDNLPRINIPIEIEVTYLDYMLTNALTLDPKASDYLIKVLIEVYNYIENKTNLTNKITILKTKDTIHNVKIAEFEISGNTPILISLMAKIGAGYLTTALNKQDTSMLRQSLEIYNKGAALGLVYYNKKLFYHVVDLFPQILVDTTWLRNNKQFVQKTLNHWINIIDKSKPKVKEFEPSFIFETANKTISNEDSVCLNKIDSIKSALNLIFE